MSVNIEEQWEPEPELKEMPPRRLVRSDLPDHNRPNTILFMSVSIALLVAGLLLFFFGLSGSRMQMTGGGLVGAVVGLAGVVFFPYRSRMHDSRAERLVSTGVPAPARLLTADNISPDNVFGRSVRYQVVHPVTGELMHRQVNCDDRALPPRIPSNVTALVDTRTGDYELYCVLPFRAIAKTAPAAPNPLAGMPTVAPSQTSVQTQGAAPKPAAMETLANAPMPERKTREAEEKKDEKKRESYE